MVSFWFLSPSSNNPQNVANWNGAGNVENNNNANNNNAVRPDLYDRNTRLRFSMVM